jgi:hypothetical protein
MPGPIRLLWGSLSAALSGRPASIFEIWLFSPLSSSQSIQSTRLGPEWTVAILHNCPPDSYTRVKEKK